MIREGAAHAPGELLDLLLGPRPLDEVGRYGRYRFGDGAPPGRDFSSGQWSISRLMAAQAVGSPAQDLLTFVSPDGAPHWWAVFLQRDTALEVAGMDDINTFARLEYGAGKAVRGVNVDTVRGSLTVRVWADRIRVMYAANVGLGNAPVPMMAAVGPSPEGATANNEARRTFQQLNVAGGATAVFTVPVAAVQVSMYIDNAAPIPRRFRDGKGVTIGGISQDPDATMPVQLDIPNGARTFEVTNSGGAARDVSCVFRLAL